MSCSNTCACGNTTCMHTRADRFGRRKEDYDKARVLLDDAARSGSYLYPIKVP